MDLDRLLELLLAGGLAGVIGALTVAWKTRRDADRDDRQQRSNENSGAAVAAKAITDAAGAIVKLQDDQVDEFKLQIRALQAESAAMSTRLDIEIQARLRAEARASINEDRIKELDDRLARMGAQFELVNKEREDLKRENGAMKTKLFEMSVGIQSLVQQVTAAGLEPVYVLDVPALNDPQRSTGKLGPLDALTIKRIQNLASENE